VIHFLLRWFVLTVAVFVAAHIRFLGITYDHWSSLLAAALILGIANALLKPVLVVLSFPLVILTFGLFLLVINALLLYLVGTIVSGFHVPGFLSALGGSLVISLVRLILESWVATA
jgi:putative membrane protein